MDLKQCEKCGETVDAAKAFCPGCGQPLVVEEERTRVSEYDASAGTVQYGKTVFGRLLSDMGLNISDPKSYPSKGKIEINPEPTVAAPESVPVKQAGSGKTMWIIAGVAVLLFAAFAVIALAVLLLIYLR